MFKLEIKTDGHAFREPFTGEESNIHEALEVCRILDVVRKQMAHGERNGSINDINGNKVCAWRLS